MTATHLTTLRRAIDATGGRFPEAVATALADRDRIREAAAAFRPASPDQLGDAIAACLLRGDDPAADQGVQAMTTSRAMTSDFGMAAIVNDAADRRAEHALAANVGAVLDIMRKSADEAGQTLAAAFAILGDCDLQDSDRIVRLGPDAARAWADATAAQDRLRTIDNGWVALANLTRFTNPTCDGTTRLADVDIDTFEQVGRNAEPWAIVRAGGTITLGDAEAMTERVDRLAQGREHRVSEYARQRQAAIHQEFGFVA
jgi:hypothetical protein